MTDSEKLDAIINKVTSLEDWAMWEVVLWIVKLTMLTAILIKVW